MTEQVKMQQWGQGDNILVFLHYFGGSALSWQWVANKLSDEYKCIAFNLPGFGNNPPLEEPSIEAFAQYVAEELKQLEIHKFTLIGHSMGGKIALQLAKILPEQVEQVILVAPSPPTVERMPEKEKERMLHHPDHNEAERTVRNVTFEKLPDERFKFAIESQLIIDHKTWRWWLLDGMNHAIADEQTKWEMPVIVISSEDDTAITPEMIEQDVMPNLPVANLIETKGVGHLFPLEVPDWLAERIQQLVAEKKEENPTF